MTRVGTALRLGAREFRRTPLLVALLVVAPAYVIGVFTLAAPDGRAVLHLVGGDTVRTTLPEAFPAFTTPMTAALLAGIAGLFLMHSAADADGRLVVAGYRSRQVVLSRLGLLAVVAAVASAVSVGVMLTAFEPSALGWFLLGTGLTALLYGMVGVLAGILLDKLPGVYLILFGSMIDLFVFQNPMATSRPDLATYLPGHFPLALAMNAGFAGSVDLAQLAWGLAYLGVLTVAATLAFYRQMRVA
ncbi:ABC transporter permease [Halostella salina]|uniref:ABC transporter permease n=1 Tax=Halostella salina TaxID=1547897 RepID=UPI0013CED33D|nr:ABC transporter permease [Halostella salina]